jgi:DNA replication and repair protein RecF
MISDIRLQNFRSYKDDSFEFDDGVNIIVGPNASGKTNLLEGLLVACMGASYRARDPELMRHKAKWTRLDVHTPSALRTVKIEQTHEEDRIQKSFIIGDKPYKRLNIEKTLPVVLFEPNHLQLLSGSPELRRSFIDDLLEQTMPGYAVLRRQYKRTLVQRNALLKHGQSPSKQMFAWNVRLSELGGNIAVYRAELVQNINSMLQPLYREISSGKARVAAEYASSCLLEGYSTNLLKKLEAHTELDYQRGFTAYGPHRDDLALVLDGHPAAQVASRGEVRTLLLGLKIIELQIIEKVRRAKPLLLLDDVFSELDGARRRALTEFLSGYQTFITTTDADVVVQHFMGSCNIVALSPG